MRVRLAFQATAWEQPGARWAAGVIASLIQAPVRLTPADAPGGSDDLVVWVGAERSAPRDAAVVIGLDGWPAWRADELALATVDGEPLPCPGGRLTPPSDPRALPPEWLRAAFALLSREEEYQDPRRDRWECFAGTQSRLHALGVLDRPLVNRWAEQLEVRLVTAARERGQSLAPLPRWPSNKRFAAALTHDVDDVALRSWPAAFRLLARARTPWSYALRAGLHATWRAAVRPPGDDPYWNFDRWASVEARHGFKSAFYWVPPARRSHEYDPLYRLEDTIGFEGHRRRLADVLRELVGRGHACADPGKLVVAERRVVREARLRLCPPGVAHVEAQEVLPDP